MVVNWIIFTLAIGKYHGDVFPGHEKFALDFFREHKVLPLSVKCANCNSELVYRADRNQWYCNTSVKISKTEKRRRCSYVISSFWVSIGLGSWS